MFGLWAPSTGTEIDGSMQAEEKTDSKDWILFLKILPIEEGRVPGENARR